MESKMAATLHGVKLAKTSPAFLHANSTSHTWVFSAIAELIDNAYDPDVSSSELSIDLVAINSLKCLVFQDNGRGMDAGKLHKMLSFGFCEKVEVNGHRPVGHYGNGFKSGSMRLARDALVFTKTQETMSVGLLSQTYLQAIEAETVITPILTFSTHSGLLVQAYDTEGSLRAITGHSLFRSKDALLKQFKHLSHTYSGTRIILYNLKMTRDGRFEMDFESDKVDIINAEQMELDFSSNQRPVREAIPEYRRSLREYLSILYLKPRMKIMLRGVKVKTKLVARSLCKSEVDHYKPMFLSKPIKIIFGFDPAESPSNDYGMMLYHKNRLIKAYEKVGYQKQANELGVGVVGVCEVDFLEPIHNKQDFNKNERYNTTIYALGCKMNDYWHEKKDIHKIEKTKDGLETIVLEEDDEVRGPDWQWLQCDQCLKWRRQPEGYYVGKPLPEKWFCRQNPDPTHNRCDVDEEPEDEDECRASYQKTYKKQKEHKKQKEVKRKEEELKKKEKQLVQVQSHLVEEARKLKSLQKDASKNDEKPLLADLDRTRRELEEAKKKEAEQELNMRRVLQEKAKIAAELKALKESQLAEGVQPIEDTDISELQLAPPSQGDQSLADISQDADDVMATDDVMIVESSSVSRRRKADDEITDITDPKKVCYRVDDMLVMKNESDSEEEEKEKKDEPTVEDTEGKKKNTRAPIKSKQNDLASMTSKSLALEAKQTRAAAAANKAQAAASKVVSQEAPSSPTKTGKGSVKDELLSPSGRPRRGVKPSEEPAPEKKAEEEAATPLQVNMPFGKKPGRGRPTGSTNKTQPAPNRINRMVPAISNGMDNTNKVSSRDPHKGCKEKLAVCESKLQVLRKNISTLLKMIVPDFVTDKLEHVDQVVLDMLEANSVDSIGQGGVSSSTKDKFDVKPEDQVK